MCMPRPWKEVFLGEAPSLNDLPEKQPRLRPLDSGAQEGHERREDTPPEGLELHLSVRDPELVAELAALEAGPPRQRFALSALRIGVLALKQARGRIDSEALRNESDRLMASLKERLEAHQASVRDNLEQSLKHYFDPRSGSFSERVERLVSQDGELEQLLRRQIGREDSELARTLSSHVGSESPLMKILSPNESEGLLKSLSEVVESTLGEQREKILKEFSLDHKEGALSRLVKELGERHGELSGELQEKIDEVVKEFSLDEEDSALSRLMRQVESAQKQISNEFSLNEESSALARMRRELMEVLKTHKEEAARFQQEVLKALAEMKARREEADLGTRHGHEFEEEVLQHVQQHARRRGDLAEATGNTTGLIRNCKVGDCVLVLGRESAAPGGRIVLEAKESGGYTESKALEELETARKNRGAAVGVFVFSKRAAPQGLEPLVRHGPDLLVVWDVEDPATDVHLEAALSLARALCTKGAVESASQEIDLTAVERAVREVEKQALNLDDVHTSAETIEKGAEKIKKRVDLMRKALQRQVTALDGHVEDVRAFLGRE